MLPKKKLQDIFEDDPYGLLNVKPAAAPARNADERLLASFHEINDFYDKNKREPEQGGDVLEHQLYSRLKGIRQNFEKIELLKMYDKFGMLNHKIKQANSLSDIFNDDDFGLLNDNAEGLFDLNHIKSQEERATSDFVARRKPCKDFDKYESLFVEVQKELSTQKRRVINFRQDNLRAGDFYIHNGVLLLLENVDFEEGVQDFKSGGRVRKDGRTRVIFENGTESNMLYRSLYKALLDNGKAVSENQDRINEEFVERFGNIREEDTEAGYIYILKSKSEKVEIASLKNLYKIGYSKIRVEDRIKNAKQEPTYLMEDVRIVMVYKCYNMNPQKFEQLLHNFFGASCLNIDVFDVKGNRFMPREWFIAPLGTIEEAIKLIITGEIVNVRFDAEKNEIIARS